MDDCVVVFDFIGCHWCCLIVFNFFGYCRLSVTLWWLVGSN